MHHFFFCGPRYESYAPGPANFRDGPAATARKAFSSTSVNPSVANFALWLRPFATCSCITGWISGVRISAVYTQFVDSCCSPSASLPLDFWMSGLWNSVTFICLGTTFEFLHIATDCAVLTTIPRNSNWSVVNLKTFWTSTLC